MKKISVLFFTFLLIQNIFFAQCTETDKNKILLLGDSWAFFMSVDMTINRALEKWGHSHYKYYTNTILSENGAETDDFLKPAKQDEIMAQFQANPDIEVVHLSIGGNDILGDWNVDFTQAQTDSLESSVYNRMDQIIQFLKQAKPGIRIVWSGYTYPNFEEVIESFAPFQTSHPFYSTWEGMGFPSFEQINNIQMHFADEMEAYALSDPQVEYVNCPAILQYTFGQNDLLGVPPGGTYAPYSAPFPYGFPDYPSPKNSMRDYGITKDCFHLSPRGYDDMIGYQMQKFYQKFLMDDQYFLSEGNLREGAVSASGVVSAEISLGENTAAVLSFNTSGLLNDVISSANIFLRRESLSGSNPLNANLELRMVSGQFGTSVNLEADDYNATGDTLVVPCRFGAYDENGDWVRLDLPAEALHFLKNTPSTQFILTAPGFSGGMITFSGASDPDFAPVLNIDYVGSPLSLTENTPESSRFILYPNPANDILYLRSAEKVSAEVEIADISGKCIMKWNENPDKISLVSLPAGIYFVSLITEKGREVHKVIKK
ncbi:MAG: T9SS type A sorting domain-containing protein [Bacteroidia bacterium]|nr:T9SS type A sorting domain-containing protein [Bacteroidia bacterium]